MWRLESRTLDTAGSAVGGDCHAFLPDPTGTKPASFLNLGSRGRARGPRPSEARVHLQWLNQDSSLSAAERERSGLARSGARLG